MFEMYKPFVGRSGPPNRFWPVSAEALQTAEARMKAELPAELRTFYLEVGYGFYAQGTEDERRTQTNRVLNPKLIADMLENQADPQRPPEGFANGAIPFFDVGERTYLIVRPAHDRSNAVFWPDGERLVAESTLDFFLRLHSKAGFYKKLS